MLLTNVKSDQDFKLYASNGELPTIADHFILSNRSLCGISLPSFD